MPRYTIVVDRSDDWSWSRDGLDIRTVDEFLATDDRKSSVRRVINLCRRYAYLSAGYYCSLLAEARDEMPMPTVADILTLERPSSYAFALPDFDKILQSTIARMVSPPEENFHLFVFFGRPDDARFQRLAGAVFDLLRVPLLRLTVRLKKGRWQVTRLQSVSPHRVPRYLRAFFEDCLHRFTHSRLRRQAGKPSALYDLAIVIDPNEALPPSDEEALERFTRAAAKLRVATEFITARDERRIPEFDCMFIRATTALDHFTYAFARKAETEGIPVIDDPNSILRCTNKVYLNELLVGHKLPTPKGAALDRVAFDNGRIKDVEDRLGYPMVLKIPDGSFSRGVYKCETREHLCSISESLFAHSRIILAQEYMYTPFDWRVGVLNGEPLYVCRYMMSRNHWQIIHHRGDGQYAMGDFETMAIDQAPHQVIDVATKAAGMIGKGLYGVDLKQTANGVFVIEINDNPSIDHGVEDKVIKSALYERIVGELIRRVESRRVN